MTYKLPWNSRRSIFKLHSIEQNTHNTYGATSKPRTYRMTLNEYSVSVSIVALNCCAKWWGALASGGGGAGPGRFGWAILGMDGPGPNWAAYIS